MGDGRISAARRGLQGAVWRELKVGAQFTTRAQPPTKPNGGWSIRAEHIHCYADICDADTFSRLVWSTGFCHHAQLAHELIILGDGARWIWDMVADHYPHTIQIVGWFHAYQYLEAVAQVAYHNQVRCQDWLERTQTALSNEHLDEVIAACQQHIDPACDDDPAQQVVTYYTNNRHRMAYPAYRANGFHIGSGESGIKQIVQQRMKAAGAIWNLESARYVAKARATYLSSQWHELVLTVLILPVSP